MQISQGTYATSNFAQRIERKKELKDSSVDKNPLLSAKNRRNAQKRQPRLMFCEPPVRQCGSFFRKQDEPARIVTQYRRLRFLTGTRSFDSSSSSPAVFPPRLATPCRAFAPNYRNVGHLFASGDSAQEIA